VVSIPPEPSVRIRLSVIIPVFNNARDLVDSVRAVTTPPRADIEIIVVDDGSTDDTSAVAAQLPVHVIRMPRNAGPAAARNHGVRHAQGDIVMFVDSDVVLTRGALDTVLDVLDRQADVVAVFGSYDTRPRDRGVVSRYRNLLHHFVHQEGNPEASTFWAGCGAIRRAVFEKIGGFDERRYRRPSIEDIELGYRLRDAGYRILLLKDLQCTHLKRWTLPSLVRTDITGRAIPWARLILERRVAPNDLNLRRSQRASVGLVAFTACLLSLCIVIPRAALFAMFPLAVVLLLNGRLYRWFWRQGGAAFAVTCVGLHLLYFLYGGLSALYAWATPDRERTLNGPATAAVAARGRSSGAPLG
jgi:GT2 family glycosyltransferase